MKTGIKKIKLHVKKNDSVVVISGNDKGKAGRVLRVFPQKGRVIVEGVNIRKRHMRPTQTNPQGSIIEREFPIHASNVKKS
jgi:large subunit ribosomal protein L24